MRYFCLTCLAFTCLVTTAAVASPNLVGDYAVKGINPDGKSGYTGSVNISQDGETYHFNWTVAPNSYIGTGIQRGKYIAVAYTDVKGTWFGLMFYEIKEGGRVLDGQWCLAGSKSISRETLTRRHSK